MLAKSYKALIHCNNKELSVTPDHIFFYLYVLEVTFSVLWRDLIIRKPSQGKTHETAGTTTPGMISFSRIAGIREPLCNTSHLNFRVNNTIVYSQNQHFVLGCSSPSITISTQCASMSAEPREPCLCLQGQSDEQHVICETKCSSKDLASHKRHF